MVFLTNWILKNYNWVNTIPAEKIVFLVPITILCLILFIKKDKKFVLPSLFVIIFTIAMIQAGYGGGYASDDITYLSAARNIASGKGFTTSSYSASSYPSPMTDSMPLTFGPLFPLFEAISIKLFGSQNFFSIRFVNIIFGSLGVLVCYLLGKELYSKEVGLLSALIYINSFNFAYYITNGYLDLFFTSFIITSLYFMVRAFKENKTKFFALAGAFAGLAYLAKLPGAILALFFLLYFPLMSIIQRKFAFFLNKRFWAFFLAMLIVISPWLIRNKLVLGNAFASVYGSAYKQRIKTGKDAVRKEGLLNYANQLINNLKKYMPTVFKEIEFTFFPTGITNIFTFFNYAKTVFSGMKLGLLLMIIHFIFRIIKRKNFAAHLILPSFALLFCAIFAISGYLRFRFIMPIIPLLLVGSALSISTLKEVLTKILFFLPQKQFSTIITIIVISPILFSALHEGFNLAFRWAPITTNWNTAGIWLNENLPEDSIIAERKGQTVILIERPFFRIDVPEKLSTLQKLNISHLVFEDGFAIDNIPAWAFLLNTSATPFYLKPIYKEGEDKKTNSFVVYEIINYNESQNFGIKIKEIKENKVSIDFPPAPGILWYKLNEQEPKWEECQTQNCEIKLPSNLGTGSHTLEVWVINSTVGFSNKHYEVYKNTDKTSFVM